MKRRIAQVSLFGVALLIGILLVGQLRSQARPTEISSLPAQELSQLVETLAERNRSDALALSDLQETLREYRVVGSQGQSALNVGREDLRRIAALDRRQAAECRDAPQVLPAHIERALAL